jgi:hypothetical protein
VSCARREAGVAAVLGTPRSLTSVSRLLGPAAVVVPARRRTMAHKRELRAAEDGSTPRLHE